MEGGGLALSRDGIVHGVGWSFDRGDGILPSNLGRVIAVSTALLNACAILFDGGPSGFLECWDLYKSSYSGTVPPIPDRVIAVAVGYKSGCGILRDHSVKCWGD
jgi:hypothetical protein